MEDRQSWLWTAAFTARVVPLCSAIIIAVDSENGLWYVPAVINTISGALGQGMSVAIGLRSNEPEILEMLEVIESTRFEHLLNAWHKRTFHTVDYHSGWPRLDGDFVYYDPWPRRKIDKCVANLRAITTRYVPNEVATGWEHVENDFDGPTRDESWDYLQERSSKDDRALGYNNFYPNEEVVEPESPEVLPFTANPEVTLVVNEKSSAENINNIEETLTGIDRKVNMVRFFLIERRHSSTRRCYDKARGNSWTHAQLLGTLRIVDLSF